MQRFEHRERRVLVPQRRHHQHVEAGEHAAEFGRRERAVEGHARVVDAVDQRFGVAGLRCAAAVDVQPHVPGVEPAHRLEQHVHALVARDRTDVADIQVRPARRGLLRRHVRETTRIESVRQMHDLVGRQTVPAVHAGEELRRRDHAVGAREFAHQMLLATQQRVRLPHRRRTLVARRRRQRADLAHIRFDAALGDRLAEPFVDAGDAAGAALRRPVAETAVAPPQQVVRADPPEVHQVHDQRQASQVRLLDRAGADVARVEHVHEVEVDFVEVARQQLPRERVLVVAQFGIR
jgi:hypothetical protein